MQVFSLAKGPGTELCLVSALSFVPSRFSVLLLLLDHGDWLCVLTRWYSGRHHTIPHLGLHEVYPPVVSQ